MAQLMEKITAQTLQNVGIDAESATTYAAAFERESFTMAGIDMLDKQSLIDLGITKLGHQLAIFKIGKQMEQNTNQALQSQIANPLAVKLSPAKAPILLAEMTAQQFRKFRIDWSVFCEITGLPAEKYHVQLYSNAEEAVQSAIINTFPDFFY